MQKARIALNRNYQHSSTHRWSWIGADTLKSIHLSCVKVISIDIYGKQCQQMLLLKICINCDATSQESQFQHHPQFPRPGSALTSHWPQCCCCQKIIKIYVGIFSPSFSVIPYLFTPTFTKLHNNSREVVFHDCLLGEGVIPGI